MHSRLTFKTNNRQSNIHTWLSTRLLGTLLIISCMLTACGGGGSGNSANSVSAPVATTYTAGVFNPSSTYANRCASPRSGTDPYTNIPYPDTAGSATLENFWLRSSTL